MIYLSLFNGISAGRLAADRAGIKFDKYYIAEINKFTNKISNHHYPDSIQLGDVTNWREWNIDWNKISLITAGFPCQSWSLAGNQLGDKDKRGALFWITLEIIEHVLFNNPSAKFMLENVKMKNEFEQYITLHTENTLGKVFKVLINSALVSAQNRNRYYWSNFRISQPDDKGLLLKDIIDDDYITDREKSYCIMSNYAYGASIDEYFNKYRRQIIFEHHVIYQRPRGKNRGAIFTAKSPTLTACSWEHNNKLRYRKLTPTECARLQTFPDGWCESVVSNSQSYKAYGNAWTVDVIKHIFENCFLLMKDAENEG